MENKNDYRIFRNWSWKRFLLDSLFYIGLFILLNIIGVTIGFDNPMNFSNKEIIKYLFQSVLFSFLMTVWDDNKREPIIIILYKKFK